MLLNWGPLFLPFSKSILSNVGSKRKMTLVRMPEIWGDGGLTVPQRSPPEIMKFLKETEKSCQLIIEMKGWVVAILHSSWSSSRCYLIHTGWSHSLFRRLLKGKLQKRSGHLSITYSSLYFSELLKELTSYARHCVIIRFEQCPWAGNE